MHLRTANIKAKLTDSVSKKVQEALFRVREFIFYTENERKSSQDASFVLQDDTKLKGL